MKKKIEDYGEHQLCKECNPNSRGYEPHCWCIHWYGLGKQPCKNIIGNLNTLVLDGKVFELIELDKDSESDPDLTLFDDSVGHFRNFMLLANKVRSRELVRK